MRGFLENGSCQKPKQKNEISQCEPIDGKESKA
jgi:hypothetical protein